MFVSVLYQTTTIKLTFSQDARAWCLSLGRNAKQCGYKTIQDRLLVN